jgi:hypothetical protein
MRLRHPYVTDYFRRIGQKIVEVKEKIVAESGTVIITAAVSGNPYKFHAFVYRQLPQKIAAAVLSLFNQANSHVVFFLLCQILLVLSPIESKNNLCYIIKKRCLNAA